jgi:hypothetical protein
MSPLHTLELAGLSLTLALLCACPDNNVGSINATPEATILSHQAGDSLYEGYTVTFHGSVSDPDHPAEDLRVGWYLGGVAICEGLMPATDGSTTCQAAVEGSEGQLTLQVNDPKNAVGTDSIELLIVPNGAPTASIVSPQASGSYTSDELITFEGLVDDTEDAPEDLTCWWESNIAGALDAVACEPDSQGTVEGFGYLDAGDHAITLRVEDSGAKDASDSVVIDVNEPNETPTCAIIAPEDGSFDQYGIEVLFQGEVDDDGDLGDLSVIWSSDRDGELGSSVPSSSGDVTLSYAELEVATHVISLWVEDERGESCSDSIVYSVGSPPSITVSAPLSGDVVNEGEDVSFEASVSDLEDAATALTLSWASDLDGEFSTRGADSSGAISFTQGDFSTGAHQITVTVTDNDGFYALERVDLTINALPSQPTVALSPDPAITGDDLLATASGSTDPEGETVGFGYAWYQDGSLSMASTSDTLPASATTKGETWTVQATPSDSYGTGEPGEASLTIGNSDPVLATPSISPSSGVGSDEELSVSASATDDDGDSVSLSYVWDNGGVVIGSGSSLTLDASIASPGDTIQVTVTAEDGDGGVDTASASVTVDNSSPWVTSISVSPATGVTTSTLLTCVATASDVDGDTPTISYAWLTGSTSLSSSASLTLTPTDVQPGDLVVCTATATDSAGASANDSASVSVVNSDPVIADLAITPVGTVGIGDTVACSASVSDPDGGAPTVTYAWTSGATALGSGLTYTVSSADLAPGDPLTCTLSASDTDGGSAIDSDTVIIGNADPSFTSDALITPSSGITTSSPLSCAASAMDPDGSTPTITYAWTNGGSALGSGSTITLDPSLVQPGDTVTCTATATDSTGGTTTSSDAVTVDNTDPVVDWVAVSPSSGVTTSTLLTCAATAYDDDGGTPTISYAWSDGSSGATITLDPSTVSPGDTVTCTATASDTHGGSDSSSSSVTVNNSDPTVDSVAISPTSGVTTGVPLTCAATASDPDGGTPSISYAWTQGGSTIGSGSSYTVSASDVDPGDTITCTATATDTAGASDTASASVAVDNSDPSFTSAATISPSSGVTTSTLLGCSASATDPDGGTPTIGYAWTNGGSAIGSGSTLTLTPSLVQPGDTVTCTATATDSAGGSATSSDSVTVDNTDPVLGAVSIEPSSGVTTSTELTCSATASDDDGGTPTVSYTWSDGSTGDTLILDPASSTPGDTITCTATAADTHGGSDTDAASVTVDNSDPTVSVSISPTSGVLIGDLVTCSASVSDPDGGTPSVGYAWTNDDTGATIGSSAAYTISGSDVSAGDTLRCTATATDTHGGSAEDAATVTVTNQIPEVSGVAISPDPAYTVDTLTCGYSFSDADGDADQSTVAWTIGGSSAGSGTTLSSGFGSSDTVTCTVTPYDGHSTGTAVSDSITITNTAPSASTVSISPTSPVAASTLEAVVTGWSDADGDTEGYLYEWYVAGSLADTSETLDPSHTSKGKAVFVKVTPWDGTDSGTQLVSSSVTIGNTAPTEPVVGIGPSGAAEGDTLTCTLDTASTDADADAVTYDYAWFQGSTELTAAAGSTTLDGAYVAFGSAYTCEITASDGTDTATGVSDTLEPCELLTWYLDDDGDGYGTTTGSTSACDQPSGYAATDDDCDDTDSGINPGATETCDGVDEDCDGVVDFSDTDADGDGYTTCDGDCDDSDARVHPDMPEICGDEIDNDCDGSTDIADIDGDGYDGCGDRATREDCNDYTDLVYPGATEVLGDELDNDCDGDVDESDVDNDGDGYTEDDGDCDDAAPWISPAATEIPDTDIDEDCNTVELYAIDMFGSAIYADATYGSDYFPGTYNNPVATLTQAVTLAASAGVPVIAAEGTYSESLTASVDIYGGYASDWSEISGYSVLEGSLTASSDTVTAGLQVEGFVGSWAGNPVFYDGVVYPDGTTYYSVYAVSGYLTIAESRVYGPDNYGGTSYAARFANEGNVWASAIIGGAAGEPTDGADGTHYNDMCHRAYCGGSIMGVETYCGDEGKAGGSAIGVTTIEASSDVVLNGTLIVGGLAADGGDGGDGHNGTSFSTSCCGTVSWGGGPGGDGGDGGDVVLVDVTSGAGFLVGSYLTGGQPGSGGNGGDGGDAGSSSSGADNGRGGNGGDAGDGGSWVGVTGPASVYGTRIAWGGAATTGGSGGTKGSDTGSCSGSYNRWIYHQSSSFNPVDGSSGSGISSFVGLELDSTSSDEIVGNYVDIGTTDASANYTALSVADGLVARNRVFAEATGSVTAIEATGTVELLSNVVEVAAGSSCVGIEVSGEDALLVNNTVVMETSGTGLYLTGGNAEGMVNNLVMTSSGGTCIHDTTSTRDYMLNNLLYGCTSQLYYDGSGYRTLAAELDFLTVTTAAGGNQYSYPQFTDSSASDYSLLTGSPAIDAGYDVSSATFGAVEYDVIGAECPVGSDYDIGAYEQ